MAKLDELQVIAEADVALDFKRTWKEGVLNSELPLVKFDGFLQA